MRAPAFWNHGGIVPLALTPASWLWSAAGWMRARTTAPQRVPVPVICVGNLTAGGSGKTPAVLALLRLLTARSNGHPIAHALLRGYGGTLAGPVRIDTQRHTASEVGDEALLLARAAPTWIAHDRVAGALAAAAAGARVVIMDDGFQNPSLAKTLSLLVVDGATGFGNGCVIPAGPLRESIKSGLARADAVVVVGTDRAGVTPTVTRMQPRLPILSARLVPGNATALKGQRVYAFAGIGRPEKFFETLTEVGAEVVGRRAFDDHHAFTIDDLVTLEAEARHLNARLVTTDKDHVRLDAIAKPRVATLPVELVFDDPVAINALIEPLSARA